MPAALPWWRLQSACALTSAGMAPARLSVQLRHIGVLLRVTLCRRVAELSFCGVDFRQLLRKVMRNICCDFKNICGEMARRLASLFAFLKSEPDATMQDDPVGLSLYAEPAYSLYGLLSFCAKSCESKIAEANGTPALGAKDEGGTPALEATGRTLSLMRTVVVSFGRNQSLGKPDLPIHHLHVYFPVQLVHKLVERVNELHFTDVTPEDGKKCMHNGESEANSPYIVVGTYEGACPFIPSLAFQTHQDLQARVNMDSLMATQVKWPPSIPPTRAPFGLKYLCGRTYSKQSCPQTRLSANQDARELLLPFSPTGATTKE